MFCRKKFSTFLVWFCHSYHFKFIWVIQCILRIYIATHALSSGVDAKTLAGILGHTKASFTLDTYTHTTGDMQKRAAEIVGGFLTDYLGEEMKPWQSNESTAAAPSV